MGKLGEYINNVNSATLWLMLEHEVKLMKRLKREMLLLCFVIRVKGS